MMYSDVACPEIETLFVSISHFQNGSIEVYFPESDDDREVS